MVAVEEVTVREAAWVVRATEAAWMAAVVVDTPTEVAALSAAVDCATAACVERASTLVTWVAVDAVVKGKAADVEATVAVMVAVPIATDESVVDIDTIAAAARVDEAVAVSVAAVVESSLAVVASTVV